MKGWTPTGPCLALVLTFVARVEARCDAGWFGDKCQFQCHCRAGDSACDSSTGQCADMRCERGWFGPQCQYYDVAYNYRFNLTDGDDSTPLVGRMTSQVFTLSHSTEFTWLRLVTNVPGQFSAVDIVFLTSDDLEVAPTSALTKVKVSDTVQDVYGSAERRIDKVRLDFEDEETRVRFTSMYVSGGRNLALRQSASQSSTWQIYTADLSVDGKARTCSMTASGDSPHWGLHISRPAWVYLYRLYNYHYEKCRLRYFLLQTYDGSALVSNYSEPGKNLNVYDWFPTPPDVITSITVTVSKFFWPNNNYDCNNGNPSLTLCEMEVFGEIVCDAGWWGLACERSCNCAVHGTNGTVCHVATGMCPSGCREGYHGAGCLQECPQGRWGESCSNRCDNCLEGACNVTNGDCLTTCERGYKMPRCLQECEPGTYGYSCNETCSVNCKAGTCDAVDGRCDPCVAGYEGDMCEDECPDRSYGAACGENCSRTCAVDLSVEPSVCHHVTGSCLMGCRTGYTGVMCQLAVEEEGLNPAVIAVPLVAALLLASGLAGIFIWRRRRAHSTAGVKGEGRGHLKVKGSVLPPVRSPSAPPGVHARVPQPHASDIAGAAEQSGAGHQAQTPWGNVAHSGGWHLGRH